MPRNRSSSSIGLTLALLASALAWPLTPSAIAAPFGEERATPGHLDQADIDAGRVDLREMLRTGRTWFVGKFTKAEGAGRPLTTAAIVPTRSRDRVPQFFRTAGPDANACRGCHNDPETGGAGEFVANVFVSEGFADTDFDTVNPQFSNERGSPALHGSGFVELLAREMTNDLWRLRAEATREAKQTRKPVKREMMTKGVSFGLLTVHPDGFADVSALKGVDQDLIVRPFSQKGVFTSLRQFSVNALNHHHGMQPIERFGPAWTGSDDFDQDGVKDEVTPGDVTSLVVFQATLPPPRQILPVHPGARRAAETGAKVFREIGCAACHIPALPLERAVFSEPNPYNAAGNLRVGDVKKPFEVDLTELAIRAGMARDEKGRILVPVFSDLKRHRIADEERPHYANELLSQRFVNRDEFLSARLWGVGTTAPYGHRGDVTTIDEAIRHHGAEGADARRKYEALDDNGRGAVIEFLLSLKIEEGT